MTALSEALQTITFPDGGQETSERRGQVTRLFAKAGRLIYEKTQLLGVEALVTLEIDRQFEAVKKALLALLPFLSLEIFSWRDEKGWPKLAIIGLTEPTMKFHAFWHEDSDRQEDHDRDWRNIFAEGPKIPEWHQCANMRPLLPQPVRACYRDVIDRLRDMARKRAAEWNQDAQTKAYLEHRYVQGHAIKVEFGGLIPTPVRERLITAQALFGPANIFLIFEAGEWQGKIIKVDPIAAAWDGAQLRVIEVFDPTPLENLVADEYSV